MPLPRKKVEKDPPEVIEARMRMYGTVDTGLVVAKNHDGTLCTMMHDGSRPVYSKPIPQDTASKMKVGIANQFSVKWVNSRDWWMGMQQGSFGWVPVKQKDLEFYTPNIMGQSPDGMFHDGECILCKRDKSIGEADKQVMSQAYSHDHIVAQQKEYLQSQAEGSKIKNIEVGFEANEEESETLPSN